MSYCVNCGVELEPSLKRCPLCNTPVINPSVLQAVPAVSPFPEDKGQVETMHRKDFAVLTTTFLLSTAAACALLNFLVFRAALWSLPVIGICVLIWVFVLPFFLTRKISFFLWLSLDGLATALYLYLLTWLTPSGTWFFSIGLPIVILITVLLEATGFLCHRFQVSFLASALYFVIDTALLCIGIESILDLHFDGIVSLSWSAVVLTACAIMTVTLGTILSKKRLRSALRRRLHF